MPSRKFSVPSRLGLLLLAASEISNAGGSVLTYVAPPGGEGAAAVALGVALPCGLSSMEVNPALLAWEGDRTSSTVQYSSSSSDLIPELHEKNLDEKVRSVGLRYPIRPGTDVALGYSWNHVDLGQSRYALLPGDSFQTLPGTAGETVHHVVLSGRLGGFASVGIGWKLLDNRMAAGLVVDSGTPVHRTSWASTWDLGILVAPRWSIPKTPLRVGPSLGASWINVADDSIDYGLSNSRSPVARVLRFGTAGELSSPDVFSLQIFVDQETDLTDTAHGSSLQYRGWSLDVLGIYRYSSAILDDPYGGRHEIQVARQYTFDFKQLWRLKWRIQHLDFGQSLGDAPEDYPLPTFQVLGAALSPNIRILWTKSTIHDLYGTGVREGQNRLGWAISL